MKLTNTFVQSKMNMDVDERLLPKGQYPHAENIRVANSDGSDVGAIENVKGNESLTGFGLTNASTIGVYSDASNQKLYWFVTSDEKDLVVEYDVANTQSNILLESSNPDGLLNFHKDYLITGVSKIINGDSDRDLLIWTDDRNPIRKINIERAKTYAVDGFEEDDISLAQKPPKYAPTTALTYTPTILENNIEDRFLSFSYRYQYLDGEYSALSSYTNYKFAPEAFQLDYQTMENEGMVNAFNAIKIGFNTGDKRVKSIQLVVKESNSNALAIIETFNKDDEGWGNDEIQYFTFANSKKYTFLSENELYRPYDNVPRLAKAMEIIGNRVVFGNYVEGYDLVNSYGEDIIIDYDVSLLSRDLSGDQLPVSIEDGTVASDTLVIDFTGISLDANTRVTINTDLTEITYADGDYQNLFSFILNESYADAAALAASEDFILFVETIMSTHFHANYNATPPDDSVILSTTGFEITASDATSISIKTPSITYRIDNTPLDLMDSDFTDVTSNWVYLSSSEAFFREIAIDSSIKTNRSYEVGLIYLDGYNRACTVLTDKDNTLYVPQEFSINQNVLVVNINHQPPAWADRYKLVVKQNKSEYQTIYANIFYQDGLFRWVKLEGANKDKVNEGDTLIVKSDLGGVIQDVIKVRVLEVTEKNTDFIEGNTNGDGDDIIEEAGLYMKIKPTGFDMNFDDATARTFEGHSHLRYPQNTYTEPSFGTGSVAGADFVPYPLNAGSSVRIYIKFKARGAIAYEAEYDKTFRVNGDYASVEEWFDAEVVDLGSFGDDYTRDYGFSPQSEQFYVRAHRDGTASRKITTDVKFEILFSEGTVIFETEPEDIDTNIFYETEQTFDIVDNYHQGNVQNQSGSNASAIVELDFFNCYVQGNGAESYRYKDAFNKKYLNIDLRPSSTSVEKFREIRRYADLTYSAAYNENTNLNGLNEFNLSTGNYKEDLDKKYGYIQKLYSRDTDLVVFQEDKVSKVLYGKDLLLNADGTSNVSSIQEVLGQQVPYTGEYGISRNPESFAYDANNIYFTDSKRGCVCRLNLNGIVEISQAGMRTFFREQYEDAIDNKKLGAFDPVQDQYVLHNSIDTLTIPYSMTCSESLRRNNFYGTVVLEIDYGLLTGTAGFDYSSTSGIPVKYDIEYNGNTYSTGYVGDSSYNTQLAALGLPDVSGSGTGTFEFNKDQTIPKTATVTITAPLCGADFVVDGNCIDVETINVVTVILNDDLDEGLTMKSRYKWSNTTYNSTFKTYNSIFESDDEIDIFETYSGNEGSNGVPITGSTVEMQSYIGYTETAEFISGNKMGYLITDTLYTEAELADLLSAATFPTITEVVNSGDVTNKITFTYTRPSSEQYLYLIWDYRNDAPAITIDTKIKIYFDSSGSMNSTLAPLQTMRDTILKDRLLPLYDNDSDLYDASVTVENYPYERTMDVLNMEGETPEGNVIVLTFQDEAQSVYHPSTSTFDDSMTTAQYDSDIVTLRNRLNLFPTNYYRGVIFQVDGFPAFKSFIEAVQNGTGAYAGAGGLSDRTEFNYKYDLIDGGSPAYYLNLIVEALTELGYEL